MVLVVCVDPEGYEQYRDTNTPGPLQFKKETIKVPFGMDGKLGVAFTGPVSLGMPLT